MGVCRPVHSVLLRRDLTSCQHVLANPGATLLCTTTTGHVLAANTCIGARHEHGVRQLTVQAGGARERGWGAGRQLHEELGRGVQVPGQRGRVLQRRLRQGEEEGTGEVSMGWLGGMGRSEDAAAPVHGSRHRQLWTRATLTWRTAAAMPCSPCCCACCRRRPVLGGSLPSPSCRGRLSGVPVEGVAPAANDRCSSAARAGRREGHRNVGRLPQSTPTSCLMWLLAAHRPVWLHPTPRRPPTLAHGRQRVRKVHV